MTVKELREKLSQFDDDMEVETEGCDCNSVAYDVESFTYDDDATVVFITRHPDDKVQN